MESKFFRDKRTGEVVTQFNISDIKYMEEAELCPACGLDAIVPTDYATHALSRRDNKTKICPACGTREALEDLQTARA